MSWLFLGMYKNLPRNGSQVLKAHQNCGTLLGDQKDKHEKILLSERWSLVLPCTLPKERGTWVKESLFPKPLSFHPGLFSPLSQRRHLKWKVRSTHKMGVSYDSTGEQWWFPFPASDVLQGTWSKVISQGRGCLPVWPEMS